MDDGDDNDSAGVKPDTGAGVGPRSYASLSLFERLEALALADEMLLRMVLPRRLVDTLRERYNLSPKSARRVLAEAEKAVTVAVTEGLAIRRAKVIRTIMRLYERAWTDGKLQTCAGLLKQLADIEGLNRPIKVDVSDERAESGPLTDWERDAAGRPPADIQFYWAHGCWPEHAPEGSKGLVPDGPNGERFVFPLTRH